jgi:pimeloyl-ACP methyl ester carboxylesterase
LFDFPLTFGFSIYNPPTNGASITSVLATNQTRWLATYPFDLDPNSLHLASIGILKDGETEPEIYALDVNANNWFGLPFLSAKIGYDGPATVTIDAGNTRTNIGYFYPETAQPRFQTVEYDFFNPNQTWDDVLQDWVPAAIPGSDNFDVTNQSQQFYTTPGSSIQVAGYAKLAVTNSAYTGVYGYLGQYFDKAYKITNGIVSTNTTGVLSAYGNFFATEPGDVALVTMPDVDTGERGTGIVHCISLQLDKNHDGSMDSSFSGADSTSQASPMIAWINNGKIVAGTGGGLDRDFSVPLNHPEYANYVQGKVTCQRDLENFFRLWIRGVPSLPLAQNYSFTMSMYPVTGKPAVNLYWSCETNGGMGYLTDTNTAALQARRNDVHDFGYSIGTVSNGMTCALADIAFAFDGTKYLLFEGAGIGMGQLLLTITDANGNMVAETGVWLDLHDVKDLYEQAHIANVTDSSPGSSSFASTYVEDHSLPTNSAEDKQQFILFVHGWRMGIFDYQSFSDSMFKRLYWAGYRGRFAALRWPTLSKDDFWLPLLDYTTYNSSEFRAWKSGLGLSSYLTNLKQRLPNYSLNVAAHSMGNVVMAEALRLQRVQGRTNVDNYVLMQAAVPAHCYDTSLPNFADFVASETSSHTPDVYRGYPGAINLALNGQMTDFFNTNDYALATGKLGLLPANWEANQKNFKPDGGFNYSTDGTNCFWNYTTSITDSREIMAFCSRPRSKAAGALGGVGGVIQGTAVDLTGSFNFRGASHEHSAQFNWNIQRVGGFYTQLLTTFFPQTP